MVEIHQTAEWKRHRLNGFGAPAEDVEYDINGADLRVESFEPDDMRLLRERIDMDKESLDISAAKIVANETLLKIMNEFFHDGEDFHIHNDPELRTFVKDCMAREAVEALSDEEKDVIDDAWLEGMLANVQGFPPYQYEDIEPSVEEVSVSTEMSETYDRRTIETIDLPLAA